jgi:hypothetical protein
MVLFPKKSRLGQQANGRNACTGTNTALRAAGLQPGCGAERRSFIGPFGFGRPFGP